jgi:hypothetical protein
MAHAVRTRPVAFALTGLALAFVFAFLLGRVIAGGDGGDSADEPSVSPAASGQSSPVINAPAKPAQLPNMAEAPAPPPPPSSSSGGSSSSSSSSSSSGGGTYTPPPSSSGGGSTGGGGGGDSGGSTGGGGGGGSGGGGGGVGGGTL